MRQKGSSTLLFLAIFFLIIGLSSGGLKAIKEASDYVFQVWNDSKTVSVEDKKEEEIDFHIEVPDLKEKVNSAYDTDTDIIIKEEIEPKLFDTEIVQEELEKPDTEKIIITPSPLVVENKYSTTGKGALSNDGIIIFTNVEREKNGLNTLKQNNLLMQAATAKLNHMFDEEYFEHVAPSGEDVSYWVDKATYKYITVGENLAFGNFKDSEDMVIAWMESPGHRANILKEGYEEIGVAVGYGEFDGDKVWLGVQIFATPLLSCPTVNETLKAQIDMYNALVKEKEKVLSSLQPVVEEMEDLETQEEYDNYMIIIDQYNKLVAEHNEVVADLRFTVNVYNDQVKAFNTCIATK